MTLPGEANDFEVVTDNKSVVMSSRVGEGLRKHVPLTGSTVVRDEGERSFSGAERP